MNKAGVERWVTTSCLTLMTLATVLERPAHAFQQASDKEEFLVTQGGIGQYGGKLVISQRAEPRTLNPVVAVDASSKEIIGLITADLIHINRYSQQTEPALASSWRVSSDGRHYTLKLRRGLRFSDGHPFDADDVLFTFQVYLDEQVHAPQRDLLIISGKPIRLQKLDAYTVRFELDQPYAAAERLFDSIALLPRHLLKAAYDNGKLAQAWTLHTPPQQIAGLGPFRVKEYVPGQRVTLERNPYYWKANINRNRLPYLDEIVSLFSGNGEVEAMRFKAHEIDIVSRLSAANFSALEDHRQERKFHLYDLGASLEYNFLFFNLNDPGPKDFPSIARKQAWFQKLAFRRAVSAAIDRQGIVRLAYRGRAYPLSTHVTPGNKYWVNNGISPASQAPLESHQILRNAGFSWRSDGRLLDPKGDPVEFSILHNAGNQQQAQIATIVQADLHNIGMDVKVVPLEFRTMLDRIFKSFEYEAAIMALASGDADPNSEMNVWTSQGGTHVWNLVPNHTRMPWEEEIDRLMQQQMITLKYEQRKRMYDRVQQLVWENLPIICLVSPNVLIGATERLGNFRPAILSSHALWNVEELFLRR